MDIEKIYRTYFMKVYSYILSTVKNHDIAEEITQNTFLKAMTAKKQFLGNSSEYTWLCAIAKNQCIDYFREEEKKAPFPEDDSLAFDDEALDNITKKETSLKIHKFLHEMEEPYKEVFELRVFGELSFAEIAQVFGKTENWARVTYHRARLKLKERLNENE